MQSSTPAEGLAADSTVTAVATAACTLIALLALTNFAVYQDTVKGVSIFGQAYIVPILLVIPLLALRPAAVVPLLREPLFWWFAAYVILGLIWLLLIDPSEVAQKQWRLRMLSWLHFCAIYMLARHARRGFVAAVIVGCVLLAVACNYLDVVFPYRFVPKGFPGATPERGAGLFMNSNIAAAFVVTGTLAVLPLVPMRFRAAVLGLAALGVAPCFSRFGFAFAALLILMAVTLKLLNRSQLLILALLVPVVAAALGVYYDFLLSGEETNVGNIQQRLAWFEHFGREMDDSVEGRSDAAARAWRMFTDDPLLGQGVGATSQAIQVLGTHNMYLMLMAEQGIFGLGLYCSLIGIVALKGWSLRRAAAGAQERDYGAALIMFSVFLAAYGVSSHNVLEDAQTIFLLAFVVAAGAAAGTRWQPPRDLRHPSPFQSSPQRVNLPLRD